MKPINDAGTIRIVVDNPTPDIVNPTGKPKLWRHSEVDAFHSANAKTKHKQKKNRNPKNPNSNLHEARRRSRF